VNLFLSQRLLYVGLRDSELPSNSRRLDAGSKGSTHGVQFARRQAWLLFGSSAPIQGACLSPLFRKSATATGFGSYRSKQGVDFVVFKPLQRASQVLRQKMFRRGILAMQHGLIFETNQWLICSGLRRSRKQVWRRIGGTTDVHNTNYALVLRSPQSRGASSGLFLDMQAKRFGRSKLHPTLR
jgi:hypothetical protein